MKTENLAGEILREFKKAELDEEEDREVWTQCYQYMNNWVDDKLGQWKAEWRNQAGDKPTLSFNLMRKFANRICGAQRQTKIDEKPLPRDDKADPMIADVLSDIVKYVYDVNNADNMAIPRAFRDMIACGRGFIKYEFSDENDPMGDILIKSVNPFRVYLLGDGERYDLKDRRGIIEVLPLTKEDAKALWPKKAKEIDGISGEEKVGAPKVGGTDYEPTSSSMDESDDDKFKVLRRQKYEWTKVKFAQLPSGELEEVTDEANIKGLGLPIIVKRQKRIRVTTVVGSVLLDDKYAPYKHNNFDIVGFFAYTDGGRITGVMQDLIDPQNEKNKRHSGVIHILNTAPRNSFFGRKGAFDDIEDARKRIGGIGQIIEVNGDIQTALRPIESNLSAIPAIINMEVMADEDMKAISGMGDASLGIVPEGVKSGRGIESLKAPTEVIIAELFDNYLFSRKLLADGVISLIQQFYDEPKRFRIAGDYSSNFLPPELARVRDQLKLQIMMADPMLSDEQAGLKVNELLMVTDQFKIIGVNIQVGNKKLNDLTVGRYDIVIDHVSHSVTARRAQYYDVVNLKAMGAPIGWRRIIENSDLRGKQIILSEIEQEQQKAMMEMAMMEQQRTATPAKAPVQSDLQFNGAGNQSPM